jgi:hypothetical protein
VKKTLCRIVEDGIRIRSVDEQIGISGEHPRN